MSRYDLRRKSTIDRELTEEEQHEIDEYFSDNESDNSTIELSDSDSVCTDNHSECDEVGTGDNAIEDIRYTELQRYMVEDDDPMALDIELGYADGYDTNVPGTSEDEPSAIEPNRGARYIGQGKGDKTVWWSMPTPSEKTRTEHMRKIRLNAYPYTKQNFNTKIDAFKRILPEGNIDLIVIETNRKAKKEYEANAHAYLPKRMRPWRETNVAELYAYIAILLHAGAEKSNNVCAKDLFAQSNMPFYRAVMTLKRFEQLTRFLRFDDSRTRLTRLQENKLAPIHHVWSQFLNRLTLDYVPSLDLCVDEQLLVTRNRCSFRQYIPSKPGRFVVAVV